MRFKTFGRLRPSIASNEKLITLLVSSEGDFPALRDGFQDSESPDELCSSLFGEMAWTSLELDPTKRIKEYEKSILNIFITFHPVINFS